MLLHILLVLQPLDIFNGNLVILKSFGAFFHALVYCTNKNLATLHCSAEMGSAPAEFLCNLEKKNTSMVTRCVCENSRPKCSPIIF
jgi:hypothetical protein